MSSSVAATPITFVGESHLKQYAFEEILRSALIAANTAEIETVRDRVCVFDFSSTTWSDLGTLLWLISLLYKLRTQGNEIQLVLPDPVDSPRQKFWDFLIRWRFFETLAICVDDPLNILRPDQVQHLSRRSQYGKPSGPDESGLEATLHTTRLLEITALAADSQAIGERSDDGEFAKYTDRILIAALGQNCGWAQDETTRFVQLVIGEGLRNSIAHAQGSFATISMRLDPKNLTLAISDNGMGIPETLRVAYKKARDKKDVAERSDSELIRLFTEPEIVLESHLIKGAFRKGTTSADGRKGVGLFYLKNTIMDYNGTLRIRSGRACVDFTSEGDQRRDGMLSSPGTTLRITAPRRK